MKKIRKEIVAIVLNNGKILVIHEAEENYWGFPKGGIEKNETEIQALTRELKEEINLTDFKILKKSKHSFGYPLPLFHELKTGFKGKKFTVFFIKCENKAQIQTTKEINGLKWVLLEETEKHLSMENLKQLMKKIKPEIIQLIG